MSDYPMLISNKLHSFRNFLKQNYEILYCLNFANKTKNISNTTKYALLIF